MPEEQEPQDNHALAQNINRALRNYTIGYVNQPPDVVTGRYTANQVWNNPRGYGTPLPTQPIRAVEGHEEPYFTYDEFETGIAAPAEAVGAAQAPDTYAINDETGVGDWRMYEVPKKKKEALKVVEIDKATFNVIKEISEEIIQESLYILQNIYKNRLDFIENNDYNGLLESVPNRNDGHRVAPESESFLNFENTIISWAELAGGSIISNYGMQRRYLERLEKKAKQRYSIEHSKYKYYPRLKGTVKYGNPELLVKLLSITQIGKGKVVCK